MYGYFHRHTLLTEARWQGSPVKGPVSEVVFKSVVLNADLTSVKSASKLLALCTQIYKFVKNYFKPCESNRKEMFRHELHHQYRRSTSRIHGCSSS